MNLVSGIIVIAFGLSLIGFTVLIMVKRQIAERFLKLFASSAQAHYLEQFLRLVVGISIIIFSASMWHSYLFLIFGWLIVVTTVGLLLTPWRWHHQFAEKVIPMVIRYLQIYGVGTFALGSFLLYGVSRYASQ
jgi:uncharacterized protein YjeT (DUF2065 family)